jgi:hypothetical protein
MIRTLPEWNSSDPGRWPAAQSRYQQHLHRIGPRLPPVLRTFVNRLTLHDDRIVNVQMVNDVPSGRDAVVTIESFRDGHVGTAELIILHMIGVRGSIKKTSTDLDIMFFDIEILKPRLLRMSFALADDKTWKIDFTDIGIYTYDYLNRR